MIADKNDLDKVVEAILFVSGNAVELKDIAEKLEVDVKDVKKAVENLKEKHKDDGFNIITYKESAQFSSNPIYAEDIATVLNPIREKQLTKAALETLAIVAYKQPVTKLDIEQVRGVNSDYAVQVLTSFKLIEVVGRKDAVGKPLLYGTTDEFLKRFDLQDINDLPDYDELLSRIKILHDTSDSLYKSDEIIPEEELPDSVAKREEQEKKAQQENLSNNEEQSQENDLSNDENSNKNEEDSLENKPSEEPVEQNAQPEDLNFTQEKDLKEILTNAFEEQEVWTTKDSDLL
jgi:segregation and condensation protein B